VYIEETPVKKNKRKKSQPSVTSDGESAYQGSDIDSQGTDVESLPGRLDVELNELHATSGRRVPLTSTDHHAQKNTVKVSAPAPFCGLCETCHRDGECSMTESSENLVEYREMLILHAEHESWENRVCSYIRQA
jgi:chromodomain-helicase-DNA-binding protein 4